MPRSLKVIVADDDALQRTILASVLRKLGHTPIEASEGIEAYDLLCAHRASLLVCDLFMPGLDGNALTTKIRETIRDRYVHIIMVTGQDQMSERKRALQLGVDEFMGKPLEVATLMARISVAERLVQHEDILQEKNRILEDAQRVIEKDLQDAARAQRRILPAARIEGPLCSFYSAFVPSSYVSGDMFATFDLPNGRTGFYVIDVSGHGVSAALLSVALGHLVTVDYFQRYSIAPDGTPAPAGLADVLNARFHVEESDDYFTLFCGIVDHATGQLHFCQAGSPSPVIVGPEGTTRVVGEGGFPVGLFAQVQFESGQVPFAALDTLVLCSDGATEAEDPRGESFGDHRLTQVIVDARVRDLTTIPEAIVAALRKWRGQSTLDDDLTVLVCQRRVST